MRIYWNHLDSKIRDMTPFDQLNTLTSINNGRNEGILPIIWPMSEDEKYYKISISCGYGWNFSEYTITKLKDGFASLVKEFSVDEVDDIKKDQRTKGNVERNFEIKNNHFQLFVPRKFLEPSRGMIEKIFSSDQCLVPDLDSD